ncbi:DUF6602 domain-containing protein [Candidatus Poriferisocius sp.]|uniref:DUF6602 domain-containing protein n=1 Tax=Candidatus Poriferisocius sp. TaxID=3101276 RepID=UPI003B01F7F9
MKNFDLAAQFAADADDLARARDGAGRAHRSGNISTAGNEVEEACRDYFRRMLPDRYCVTTGHLIDFNGNVSPQQDIIVADTTRMSSLYTTRDGTEYIPATSVFAIGEVKSAYYHSEDYFGKYRNTLQTIGEMDRPLIENTCPNGAINASSLITDIVRPHISDKYNNRLFSFLLCVDGGDFEFAKVRSHLRETDPELVPCVSVLLDRGMILYAEKDVVKGLGITPYPGDHGPETHNWCWFEGVPKPGGTRAGAHLSMLYAILLDHLLKSDLGHSGPFKYLGQDMRMGDRRTLQWAD